MAATNQHILTALSEMETRIREDMSDMRKEHREDFAGVNGHLKTLNGRTRHNENAITRLNVFAGIGSAIGVAAIGAWINKFFG